MNNTIIGRFEADDAQGVVKAEDGSWQVVVDTEGFPHLWVRVPLPDVEAGEGLLCIDHCLDEGVTIKGLMSGAEPSKPLTPEEQAKLDAEYDASKPYGGLAANVPCPR